MAADAIFQVDLRGTALEALQRIDAQTDKISTSVDALETNAIDSFRNIADKSQNSFGNFLVTANQGLELFDKFASTLDFTQEYNALETSTKRFSNLTGTALDEVTGKAFKLGEVFGENSQDILKAANALTKQVGGTFQENLELIQTGFEAGANLNGDLLDQLSEYGPQLKAAGLNAAEGVAIIAQAAKDGIYSDKAIDAIKEGGISIRELGKSQIDALVGIGIEASDLAGKSTFESLQIISAGLQGVDEKARQLAVSDIFKGAGEDAGFAFIEGLATLDLDVNNLPKVREAGQGFREFFANVKVGVASIAGSSIEVLQGLSAVAPAIIGLTSAYNFLTAAETKEFIVKKASLIWTSLVTGAQWLWNASLWAGAAAMLVLTSPITLVILGVGLLVAGVIYAYNHFEGFRNVVNDLGSTIYNFIESNPMLSWINDVIDKIGEAYGWIKRFLGGLFGGDGEEIEVGINQTVKNPENIGSSSPALDLGFGAPKTTSPSTSSSLGGSSFSGAEKKNINVSIQNLVKEININTSNLTEGASEIRKAVETALVGAVRDFEVAI